MTRRRFGCTGAPATIAFIAFTSSASPKASPGRPGAPPLAGRHALASTGVDFGRASSRCVSARSFPIPGGRTHLVCNYERTVRRASRPSPAVRWLYVRTLGSVAVDRPGADSGNRRHPEWRAIAGTGHPEGAPPRHTWLTW